MGDPTTCSSVQVFGERLPSDQWAWADAWAVDRSGGATLSPAADGGSGVVSVGSTAGTRTVGSGALAGAGTLHEQGWESSFSGSFATAATGE